MLKHITTLSILLTLTGIVAKVAGLTSLPWTIVPGCLTVLFIALAARPTPKFGGAAL